MKNHDRANFFSVLVLLIPILVWFDPKRLGFPLDDAWIFTAFAKNLRELGEWSYNAGEPCAGVTSLLWTWLLARIPGAGTSPFAAEIVGARLLSIGLGLVPLAWSLVWFDRQALEGSLRFRKRMALFLTLLTLGHGMWLFHVYSGMETVLFVSLGMLALRFHIGRQNLLAGIAIFFLILTRLEGALLGGLLALDSVFESRRASRGTEVPRYRLAKSPSETESTSVDFATIAREFIPSLKMFTAPEFLGSGLALAITVFHNWRLFGAPFPATFAGRRFLFKLDPDRIHFEAFGATLVKFSRGWMERIHDWYWMDNFLPSISSVDIPGLGSVHFLSVGLSILMGVGICVLLVRCFDRAYLRNGPALYLFASWTLLHNLFYVTVLPVGAHAGRYQALNYLWPPLLAIIGAQEIARLFLSKTPFFSRTATWKAAAYAATGLLLLTTLTSIGVWKKVLGLGIERLDTLHLAAGDWSKKNLDEETRVVAFDLGAYKMASGLYVVDQSGLLDERGLASFRLHNSHEFYRERKATHLFRFERFDAPDPTFPPETKVSLRRVFEAALPEEMGLDREACQNTWSRCSIFEIVYQDPPPLAPQSGME